MKRFILFLLCGLLAASCTKPPVDQTPPATLSVSPLTLSFTTDGTSSLSLTVSANTAWTATVANGGSWCSVDPYHGTGNATLTVTAATNKTAQARSTTITFNAAQCTPVTVSVSQVAGKEEDKTVTETLQAHPRTWDKEKRANITYQVNVYSFADSDGDGWGDLKGVTQHLDYFESLGVSALWLSPVQASMSYHGYDVKDYNAINPKLGTEADFKDLIEKAKAKGIGIYMDYVLNHSGSDNNWFQQVKADPTGPYRNHYVLSDNPASDVAAKRIDNYGGSTSAGMGRWYTLSQRKSGRLHFKLDWSKKTVTVTQTDAAAEPSNTSATKWLYYGNGTLMGLYETSSGIFEITVNYASDWGFLIRTSTTSWDNGTKWGSSIYPLVLGSAYTITNENPDNIEICGEGGSSYFASFDRSMPDLNYGPYSTASQSAAFKDLAASADKWIKMGVAGLRLDAVIWIYQNQTAANVSFLKQWYDHCNTTWKGSGGSGDFYMVGEAWCDSAEQMAPYYEGLPSCFNFYYWYTLKDRITKSKGDDFAATVLYFQNLFRGYRPDFIDAIKLTNHDENRAAQDLGRNLAKEKLAAAVLLTSPGKPYVYQGEELGYWGDKGNGDEYVRAPVKWTRTGTVPSAALNGKVDNSMLSADISVEAQEASDASLLNTYKTFAQLRNNYPALASGQMTEHKTSSAALAAWKLTADGQKLLVVHNFSGSKAAASFGTENLTDPIAINGGATLKTTTHEGQVSDRVLTLDAYSSVVFAL